MSDRWINRLLMVAVLAVLLVVAVPALAQEATQESTEAELTDEEKIWGLMQVWAEAKFNFPFFDQVPTLRNHGIRYPYSLPR